MPLVDQYRDEIKTNKNLGKLKMVNCLLKWWREGTHMFPTWSKMEQFYFCNPATSAPSKWIFIIAICLISNLRCRLKCKTDGMIFFVNRNL